MIEKEILKKMYGKIIVSCQALADEPLHGSEIMAKVAMAAKAGGASGIRANGLNDVLAIQKQVNLPIIAIIKAEYPGSEVYITPTLKEIKSLAQANPEIIAMDCTNRQRPKETLEEIVKYCKINYPNIMIMADCASIGDAILADQLEFDILGTTLSGYTEETKGTQLPNIALVKYMVENFKRPVFCEGGIKTPDSMNEAFNAGAQTCVIGGAITRPNEITQYFVDNIKKK